MVYGFSQELHLDSLKYANINIFLVYFGEQSELSRQCEGKILMDEVPFR